MALNPQLFPNGMPVPFLNEMFVLARDGVEFQIDKIPGFVSPSFFSLIFFLLDLIVDADVDLDVNLGSDRLSTLP